VRSRTAELLSRLSSDRLSGPRVKLILSRLLPISLADLLLSSPRMALGVYDGTHENPELVWGPAQRQRLEAQLNKMQNE
jgi:DnaJ family protein C protein 13